MSQGGETLPVHFLRSIGVTATKIKWDECQGAAAEAGLTFLQ